MNSPAQLAETPALETLNQVTQLTGYNLLLSDRTLLEAVNREGDVLFASCIQTLRVQAPKI
jgi:hypothetical protein